MGEVEMIQHSTFVSKSVSEFRLHLRSPKTLSHTQDSNIWYAKRCLVLTLPSVFSEEVSVTHHLVQWLGDGPSLWSVIL